jgi:hypothetical protein
VTSLAQISAPSCSVIKPCTSITASEQPVAGEQFEHADASQWGPWACPFLI